MLLTPDKSLCETHQKTIVSKEELISQKTCCDFLLLNDTVRKAYFIELKGRHIEKAIPQLESGYNLFRSELAGYDFYFRIVVSKVRTLGLQDNAFRKFKDKWGSHLQYKIDILKETL